MCNLQKQVLFISPLLSNEKVNHLCAKYRDFFQEKKILNTLFSSPNWKPSHCPARDKQPRFTFSLLWPLTSTSWHLFAQETGKKKKRSCSQEYAKSFYAYIIGKLKRLHLGWRQFPSLIPVKIFLFVKKKAMLKNITNGQGFTSWDSRVLNPESCQMHAK